MPNQEDWRFCQKCQALFFNGFPNKGRCPAGGGHRRESSARNFFLPHDVAESNHAQGAWRFCHKCNAMFFDGFPTKGSCPGGGGHESAGFVFVLPHDIPAQGLNQGGWRFCHKCFVMFFDNAPGQGRCAAGGGHEAQGFLFVLRFRGNLEDDVDLNPVNE
ncbi:MAG TPA: hypothetical protein VGD69_07825 [Herpetosiphonaceae bacterium]